MSRRPRLVHHTRELKTMHHVVVGVMVVMSTVMLSDVTARCPETCFCRRSSRSVFCSRRGLDAVPRTVPPGTRQLHLNGNHFKSPVVRRTNFSRFPDVYEVRGSVLVEINCSNCILHVSSVYRGTYISDMRATRDKQLLPLLALLSASK